MLDTTANWLEIIGFVALIITTVNTLWLRADRARQNAPIYLELHNGKRVYRLPTPVRRQDFSRAEVMGRLGTIPMRGDAQGRYKIAYISNPKFLADIERIYTDNLVEDTLVIPCDDTEYDQFDIA
jgi:hypothetical protein